MKPEQIEKLSRDRYERNRAKINALLPEPRQRLKSWEERSEAEKDIVRSSTREVIEALYAELGEGMPSAEDCREAYRDNLNADNRPSTAMDAVRNLMLSAFARQSEEENKRSEAEYARLIGNCQSMDGIIGELQAKVADLVCDTHP